MADQPTLYVCHGDEGGPRMHPCRRVQEAMQDKGIAYEKVVAGHGNPIPFLRRGSRDDLRAATGGTKLPALKLADGTVITQSRKILAWVSQQEPAATSPQEPAATPPQEPTATPPQEPAATSPQEPTATPPQEPTATSPQEPTGTPPQEPTGTPPQEQSGI